jgi:hypothetical protein
MSAPREFAPEPLPYGLIVVGAIAGLLFVVFVAAGVIGGQTGFDAVFSLLFGWISFFLEALPRMRPDWLLVAVSAVAFVLLLTAVDRGGRRWTRGRSTSNRWTWRSSIAATFGLMVLFAAGTALVAATHQVLWLATVAPPASATQIGWGKPSISPIQHARQSARASQSRWHLKDLAMALHNYHDAHGRFPAGAIHDAYGRAQHGWTLPLSGSAIWFAPSGWQREPWDSPQNATLAKSAVPGLVHPELGYQFNDRGFALMHYAGNVHIFPNNRGMTIAEITDGTSNTLAIGEVAENFQPWASPFNRRDPADGINDVPWGFGGPPWQHGAQFALADGSVRLVSKNIDRKVLRALGTPTGNDNGELKNWER